MQNSEKYLTFVKLSQDIYQDLIFKKCFHKVVKITLFKIKITLSHCLDFLVIIHYFAPWNELKWM